MQKQLEFRGIHLTQLIDYINELGGEQISSEFPMHFTGPSWKIEISKEEMLEITSRFHVNAVFILFTAQTEDELAELIASFRKKTTRVGG
jgi:hypothetical protein